MGFTKQEFRVVVAGKDVTSRFAPRLLDLTVERSAGKAADCATVKIANPKGEVFMPSERAAMTIDLGGEWAFEGFVSEVQCDLSKGSGRTMSITASSVDQGSKAKEPMLRHMDDATLSEVATEFGQKAGLDVQVSGSIATLHRDYWIQQNESFQSWGQRVANEVGGTFKIIGSRAFMTARNEGLSASGRTLTEISAVAGDNGNLISASIRPIVSRPKFRNVEISYFDTNKGERVTEEIDTGIGDVEAKLRSVINTAGKDHAQQKANALGKESDREKGQGDIVIVGDARAEPEAICTVAGVMPGADGAYRIDTVLHRMSKSGGFQTSLTLRQPQSGAGKDPRE